MNSRQRTVFVAVVAIDAAMAIIPPWLRYPTINSRGLNAGYSFLMLPPDHTAKINVLTLLIQIAIVSAVGAATMFYLKDDSGRKTAG